MKFLSLSASLAVLILSACSGVKTTSVTRLGPAPALSGGTYSSGGGITLATEFRDIRGQTALCGVWSQSTSQSIYTEGAAPDVLASGAAYLGKTRALTGLSFLAEVPPTTSYGGASARCALTGIPWQPSHAKRPPRIRLPRQIVYNGAGRSPGLQIFFRPSGPGALSRSLEPIEMIFATMRRRLGPDTITGGGRYSSGGTIRAIIEIRRINARSYVCGIWHETRGASPRTERQAPEVLARGQVFWGGKPLLQDLRFLRRVASNNAPNGRLANCRDTGRIVTEEDMDKYLSLRFPPFVVYPGPGEKITFHPIRPDM